MALLLMMIASDLVMTGVAGRDEDDSGGSGDHGENQNHDLGRSTTYE